MSLYNYQRKKNNVAFCMPVNVLVYLRVICLNAFVASNQIINKLESALCGDANPRRLQRQSCCG